MLGEFPGQELEATSQASESPAGNLKFIANKFAKPVTLAPEIIDAIIDHLYDDATSLHACSLTCKQLLLSSRYHIFVHITVAPFSIENFLELLESTPFDTGSLVKRLEITDYDYGTCVQEGFSLDTINEQLLKALRYLKNLTFLKISFSPNINPDILGGLSHGVREIELYNMAIEMETLYKILNTLRGLQILSLDSVYFYSSSSDEENLNSVVLERPLSQPFCIRRLRVLPHTLITTTAFILEQFDPVPIVLDLHCSANDLAEAHESRAMFLHSVGHSMQSLHLDLQGLPESQGHAPGIETESIINISYCTSLQSLTLDNISPSTSHSHWTLQIISQVASHSLREIVLDFKTPPLGTSWIDKIDMIGISDALKKPIFGSLKKLVVDCRSRVDDDYSEERLVDSGLEKSLSEGPFLDFHKRGILLFDHTGPLSKYGF